MPICIIFGIKWQGCKDIKMLLHTNQHKKQCCVWRSPMEIHVATTFALVGVEMQA